MHHVRHRPEVGYGRREDTPEGEALVWRVQCACGTPGQTPYYRHADALAACEEHQLATAPPPDKACREPKRHRVAWHDWCPLCAWQLALPGMEDGVLVPRQAQAVAAGVVDDEAGVRA